jgi:hypothetical protein
MPDCFRSYWRRRIGLPRLVLTDTRAAASTRSIVRGLRSAAARIERTAHGLVGSTTNTTNVPGIGFGRECGSAAGPGGAGSNCAVGR